MAVKLGDYHPLGKLTEFLGEGIDATGQVLGDAYDWLSNNQNPGQNSAGLDGSGGTAGQGGGDRGFGAGGAGGRGGLGSDPDAWIEQNVERARQNALADPAQAAAYQAWANSPEGAAVGGDYATYAEIKNRPANNRNVNIAAPSTYQDQARAQQQKLIDELHGIASGKTVTAAQDLFTQQVRQAQNNSMSAAADLENVGPGGQAQIAAQNKGRIQMQGAQQANMLQEQQQRAAMEALTRLYEDQRNQDLTQAEIQSSNELGNRSLNDLLGIGNAQREFGLASGRSSIANAYTDANLGYGLQNSDRDRRTANDLLSGAGTIASYLGQAASGAPEEPRTSSNNRSPLGDYELPVEDGGYA